LADPDNTAGNGRFKRLLEGRRQPITKHSPPRSTTSAVTAAKLREQRNGSEDSQSTAALACPARSLARPSRRVYRCWRDKIRRDGRRRPDATAKAHRWPPCRGPNQARRGV